jgi:hypothetical protein
MPKASAEARERCIAAMIEEACLYADPYAPILWSGPDDPTWLTRRKQELRDWLEPMSDSALEHERLRLGSQLGKEIGTSLFEHEPSNKKASRVAIRLRKLLLEHPGGISEDSAYRLLRLYPRRKGEPPLTSREEFHPVYLAETSALEKKRDNN